jgi:hypothetical protein
MTSNIDTTIQPVKTEIDLKSLAETVCRCHQEVASAALDALSASMAAGDALLAIEASGQVQHGEWAAWISRNCELNPRTARRYMQLARARPEITAKWSRATDLSIAAALRFITHKKDEADAPAPGPEDAAREQNGAAPDATESQEPADDADDAAESAEARKKFYAGANTDHTEHAGDGSRAGRVPHRRHNQCLVGVAA